MGTSIRIYATAAEGVAEKAGEELVRLALAAGVEAARRYVPVDTGALRDSIRSEQDGSEGEYGSDLEYSIYVEMGTSKMSAQPYLRPSIDAMKSVIR